jgi:lysosomal acid phosphatase
MKAVLEVYKENADIIRNVSDYLNKYSGGNASLYAIWDSLTTDDIEGFTLPDWTKPVYPEPLSYIIGQESIAIYAGSDAITRIVSSALIIQIVSLMESKINSSLTPDYKMYYYSSHDITLVALQAVLGIPKSSIQDGGLVHPGSAMIYELHRYPDNSRRVQVLYVDGLSADLQPAPVDVAGCQHNCTFSQLLDTTAKFRNFTSVHDECYST